MNAITILDSNNAPLGPFTRAQVADKLQRGEVTLSSLAFVEGLAQWTPLGEVLARVDAANPPPPPVAAPAVAAPLAPTPGYSYAATMEPPAHIVYAGFWLRLVAHFIDVIIFLGVLTLLAMIVFGPFGIYLAQQKSAGNGDAINTPSGGMLVILVCLELLFYGGATVGGWLYFAILESGKWQGTLGKRVLGLRVTGIDGQHISFGRASGRYFAKIISGMTFFVGYIMAGFTDRKQALHDMIAGTLVVRG
jgi:uncharacterized RDD family membrane protein YckC